MEEQDMSTDRTINERVIILENSVQSLTVAITHTNQSIEKTNDSIAKLGSYINDSFTDLHDKLGDKNKPNWGLLISGISVFSGLFFTILTLRVEPIKSDIDSINKITQIKGEMAEKRLDELEKRAMDLQTLLEWKHHVENEAIVNNIADGVFKLQNYKDQSGNPGSK
jgi:uncharacterized coiled-coil protein SlyX